MKTSLQKIQKATSHNILITYWSHKYRHEWIQVSKGLYKYGLSHQHAFLLKQEQQPQCTVKHFYIKCGAFVLIRKHFFNVNNKKDLFENVKIDNILSFLERNKIIPKRIKENLINTIKINLTTQFSMMLTYHENLTTKHVNINIWCTQFPNLSA